MTITFDRVITKIKKSELTFETQCIVPYETSRGSLFAIGTEPEVLVNCFFYIRLQDSD